MKNKLFISIVLALAFCSFVLAQDKLKTYEKLDFTKSVLKRADLNKLELNDLSLLRGVVFGKHGRVFKEQTIQNYLRKQSWYKPNQNFTNEILTATERKNIDLIRETEAAKHDSIQPGDLRFHEDTRRKHEVNFI